MREYRSFPVTIADAWNPNLARLTASEFRVFILTHPAAN